MNPQVGFEEEHASKKVAFLLKDFGLEVYRGIAKTGVVSKKTASRKISRVTKKINNSKKK